GVSVTPGGVREGSVKSHRFIEVRKLYRLILLFVCALVLPAHAARFSDPAQDVREAVELIERRLALMEHVALWKRAHDMPIEDAARERRVLDATVEQARALGINADA